MKRIYLVLIVLLMAGCAYKGQTLETYIDHPETFVKDPHFSGYHEKLDALESSYLSKKITFAQYSEQKKSLEDQYTKEVQERNAIIAPER